MDNVASLYGGQYHLQRQLVEKKWGIHKIRDKNDMTNSDRW